ncbi:MAG: class I SAM-dependent methyltransferase [Bdellovibrionales bacterium]|nr:class I SAM-dependent methyltransferase [Bdellovibrionales bacterium]
MSSPDPEQLRKIAENLAYNQGRWGDRQVWEGQDAYGYNWGGKKASPSYHRARLVAEKLLFPCIDTARPGVIAEIAPGGGRFTAELVRISSELHLVDLNQACIDICKERFKYYEHVHYYKNDGISLEMLPSEHFDVLASYDSLVHVAPEIIRGYVIQGARILKPEGIIWFHHANRFEPSGHRTDMSGDKMKRFAEEAKLELITQHFLSEGLDCISVLRAKP